jgi:hypothetical protein
MNADDHIQTASELTEALAMVILDEKRQWSPGDAASIIAVISGQLAAAAESIADGVDSESFVAVRQLIVEARDKALVTLGGGDR